MPLPSLFIRPRFPSLARLLSCLIVLPLAAGEFSTAVAPSPEDWRSYLGEDTRTHYSPLAQIDPANVAKLEQVWTYSVTPSGTENPPPWSNNPIIIAGTLYAVAPGGKLVALEATSGTEKWSFVPAASSEALNPLETILGVTACDLDRQLRIFFTANSRVYAVDADSGHAVTSFGRNGRIDLLSGDNHPGQAQGATVTAPVTILGSLLVAANATAGRVQAFDARSGQPIWSVSADVDDASVLTVDGTRRLLYLSNRENLTCLDGDSGREVWRAKAPPGQALASPAVVFTLHRDGRPLAALAQATLSGRVLVFNRVNGETLLPDPEGYAVIPSQDAKNRATSPALDPANGLYLASAERPLTATDLASQEIRWRGHPLTPPAAGDPIVTGGALVFRGTTEGIVALDARTGVQLWSATLSAPAAATPATYRAAGRQYLVVPAGPTLTAFALPAGEIIKPPATVPLPARFAGEIEKIEARLRRNLPVPGGIAFYGSSTFTLWNIAEAFPDLPVTNLGFGGSQIPDLTHFANRLLLPLRPRLVVFYCGNNDVNSNFSLDEVLARYRAFSAWMDRHLPECHVLVLGNLPTPRRWAMWPDLHILNTRLAAEITRHPRQHYIDGTSIMLDPDGRLRRDRISSDNLHMNATGNVAMRDTLRPVIEAIWRKTTAVPPPAPITPPH